MNGYKTSRVLVKKMNFPIPPSRLSFKGMEESVLVKPLMHNKVEEMCCKGMIKNNKFSSSRKRGYTNLYIVI